jgi:hypothetical protein
MTTKTKKKDNMNGHLSKEKLQQQIMQLEKEAAAYLANHHRMVGAVNALRSMLAQMQTDSTENKNDGNNDASERT